MRIHLKGRGPRAAAALAVAGLLTLAASADVTAAGATPEAGPAAARPQAQAHRAPTRAEIQALFEDWNAALATGDPEAVADLYAPDAALEPTLSNVIRTDRAGIVDYFEHFLAQSPSGEIDQSYVEILGHDAAVDSGAYTFHLTDPATGQARDVAARYTFVYERDRHTGEWLIVDHHSSAMPEG
ncbi:SgcJ/EcaC family oxidoreductase [Streptomyces sp. DSM 44917]|uniref:SgcJ/EcaC family oxidoreductase n=1 Tax=Streptomyces boetiae TaxID=3075541 RepID=A0ABU2L6I3_9ACTN|nr:SgcJ/EcaC family oxidoreductase [Streptomyces sp. DSM 44917]MDT0307125.1 SgcJ/EcaC family oxidoreductase [Streptomyces sp. DSM 44917]